VLVEPVVTRKKLGPSTWAVLFDGVEVGRYGGRVGHKWARLTRKGVVGDVVVMDIAEDHPGSARLMFERVVSEARARWSAPEVPVISGGCDDDEKTPVEVVRVQGDPPFHVHSPGCRDLDKVKYRNADVGGVFAKGSKREIVEMEYRHHIDESGGTWRDYLPEFTFFPCVDLPDEIFVPTGAEAEPFGPVPPWSQAPVFVAGLRVLMERGLLGSWFWEPNGEHAAKPWRLTLRLPSITSERRFSDEELDAFMLGVSTVTPFVS
jgi:hypothetical protein